MENGARIAYVRVSTEEQNEARQKEALKQYGIDRWYVEKISGKNMNRPELRAMLEYAREGDTIYVHDWSRISRSTGDLLALVEQLTAKGVQLVSSKEGMDTSTPHGKLLMTFMAAINEFERANMLERQREGIAIAKREGKYKGRKKRAIEQIGEVYRAYMTRQKTKAELARELGISRPTLDRRLKEYERVYIAGQG